MVKERDSMEQAQTDTAVQVTADLLNDLILDTSADFCRAWDVMIFAYDAGPKGARVMRCMPYDQDKGSTVSFPIGDTLDTMIFDDIDRVMLADWLIGNIENLVVRAFAPETP